MLTNFAFDQLHGPLLCWILASYVDFEHLEFKISFVKLI